MESFIDYRGFGARNDHVGLCQNELSLASTPVISLEVCDSLILGLLEEKYYDGIMASFKELVSFFGLLFRLG